MYLVCTDPDNFDTEYKKTQLFFINKKDAIYQAKKLAGYYGKGNIYKLESYFVPTDETPAQGYSINEKGEILPTTK